MEPEYKSLPAGTTPLPYVCRGMVLVDQKGDRWLVQKLRYWRMGGYGWALLAPVGRDGPPEEHGGPALFDWTLAEDWTPDESRATP